MNLIRAGHKVLAAFVLISLSSSAFGARYIVLMKNNEVFHQIQMQSLLSTNLNLAQVSMMTSGNPVTPFVNNKAKVERSLDQIHAIIVNADDDSSVAALMVSKHVVLVEKEIFHPAPKPVRGYALTQPWAFSLNYANHYIQGAIQGVKTVGSGRQLMDDFVAGTGPKTPWGILAVKAPAAWAKSNYGQGARVAIVDTGIDKDHPALAANFEQGKDFVHDDNQPYEFADKVGHGSHCAGTIAGVQAADGFTGVAPQAKILSARVCSEQGCSNIAVAEGIDWAIAQHVDVISMSLGGSEGSSAEQAAVQAADDAGIVVVAASGNDGTPQVGFPAAYSSVIAVGAVDSTLTKANFSQWGPELAVVAPGVDVYSSVPQGMGRESRVNVTISGSTQTLLSGPFQGSPEVPTPLVADLVYAGLGQPEDFQKLDLSGKIALIQRGTIKFADKVKNAIAANAVGVLIFNNESGLISGALTDDGSIVVIPVAAIEQKAGQSLVDAINAGGGVSGSIQTVATDYAVYSGTSMATPHVAGVSLLLRAANKNLKGADVKSILKSTAHPLEPNDQNQTGSGMVDAEAAVNQAAQ